MTIADVEAAMAVFREEQPDAIPDELTLAGWAEQLATGDWAGMGTLDKISELTRRIRYSDFGG